MKQSQGILLAVIFFFVGILLLADLSFQVQAQTEFLCSSSGGCYDIPVPTSIYQKQGNGDTSQANNCGPASVVMAVRYKSGQYASLRPEEVRAAASIPAYRNTYSSELEHALDVYGVQHSAITSFLELERAITVRHNIVIVLVDWNNISASSNDYYQQNIIGGASCPQPGKCVGEIKPYKLIGDVDAYTYWIYNQDRPSNGMMHGRYTPTRDGHWLILKGEVWSFGPRFLAFDPNVFGKQLYYYSDGSPKGLNRTYSGEEIKSGFIYGIEITGYSSKLKEEDFQSPTESDEDYSGDKNSIASGVNSAQFLSHLNYSSNLTFGPGQWVTKGWKIKNNGVAEYGYEYGIVQSSGTTVEVYGDNQLTQRVSPGSEANIFISMKLPTQPGTYNTYWQLTDSFGNKFGDLLTFSFTVGSVGGDTTPPSGSFTAPSNGATITSRTVDVSANAIDNSGGSGVREVRFSAKWSGGWHDIGMDSSSPYSVNWDMCNFGVPNGDIELGMEVWDNSSNKWVYSEHYANPHISKNYDCSGAGLPSVNQWHAEAWMNKSLAGYVNHDEYWPAGVTNVTYPFIGFEKDWGTGAPYSGFPSDQFSFKIYSNLYFNGGQYFFRVCSDDGVVLEIDGEKKIDEWWDRGGCLQTDKWLDNKYHTIEVRYYENTGNAYLKLYIWGEEYPKPELEEPDGRITAPANNAYINQNPLTIWADAWDDKSGVNYVKFKVYHCVGGCQWRDMGTDNTPPYQFENWDWSALNGQQIKLAIDVYDKSGRSKANAGGEIAVNLDNSIPSVSFTSPAAGSVDEDKTVSVAVAASDTGSGVTSVKFLAGYEDGANYWHEIGTDADGSNGWGLNWNGSGLSDGTLASFYATAFDRAGNSSGAIVNGVRIGARPLFSIFLPLIGRGSGSTDQIPTITPTFTPAPTSTPSGGGQGKISYVSYPNVYTMDINGNNQMRLFYTYSGQAHPHWSPDNQFIVLSAKTGYRSCGTGECAVWDIVKVKADGTQIENLTNGYSGDDSNPTYSPNGQKIAFIANLGGTSGDLVIMDQNGSNKFPTSVSDANFSEWSPLGDKIIYCASYVTCTTLMLYDVNSNTSNQLLVGEFGGAMGWSPNGQQIAFSMKVNGKFQIYLINVDGTGLQRITNNTSNDVSPSWSPDGNWIVFTSDRDGNSEVYEMKKDGTSQTRITNNATSEWWPDWSN